MGGQFVCHLSMSRRWCDLRMIIFGQDFRMINEPSRIGMGKEADFKKQKPQLYTRI